MTNNQIYCTQKERNITPREYYRCTQGTCTVKHADCYLIDKPAPNQPSCTDDSRSTISGGLPAERGSPDTDFVTFAAGLGMLTER